MAEDSRGGAEGIEDGSRGVVITMGTDTMHYTASALSFMLHNLNAPVVITGAQRSSDRGSSDAFFNLTCCGADSSKVRHCRSGHMHARHKL